VLDTGGDCTHPDFKNRGGTSVYSAQGGQLSGTLSAALVPSVLATACAWQDDHGHGTHVSGTVAAATNNIEGVSALGHPLELVIYKVLEASGSGDDFTIASAIIDAADAGARIISLSLGAYGYSQTLQDAVTYAWQRDALVVAAAGNANSNVPFFPAAAHYAFGIAATGAGGVRATFSNYGSAVDIAAPGVNIVSTLPAYQVRPGSPTMYGSLTGTSMATPHVSALAGLIAMTTPGISASAIAQRIQLSAVSTTSGWDQYLGYGNINAYAALAGNLRSSATGGIVGQVVDADGMPVQSSVSAAGQAVVTDASGLFRISGVPAGTHVITAAPAGFPSISSPVGVVAGADTTITLYAGVPTGRFAGRVSNTAGPLAGAIVQALQSGAIIAEAVADNTGAYSVTVPAGVYDLRASNVSHASTTLPSRTVQPNGVQTVAILLARFGTITGTVRDSLGAPIANADIAVEGPARAGAVTDAQGRYSTMGVPAGIYQVTAGSTSHPAHTLSGITVANGATAIADFSLGSASVSVMPATGLVTAGRTLQFAATVTGSSNQAVTWSRSPVLGNISSTGLYTAPPVLDECRFPWQIGFGDDQRHQPFLSCAFSRHHRCRRQELRKLRGSVRAGSPGRRCDRIDDLRSNRRFHTGDGYDTGRSDIGHFHNHRRAGVRHQIRRGHGYLSGRAENCQSDGSSRKPERDRAAKPDDVSLDYERQNGHRDSSSDRTRTSRWSGGAIGNE
jgi:hypothetical protein